MAATKLKRVAIEARLEDGQLGLEEAELTGTAKDLGELYDIVRLFGRRKGVEIWLHDRGDA